MQIYRETIHLIYLKDKENRKLCDAPMKEKANECKAHAVDVDKEDNIYLIIPSKKCNDEVISKWKFELHIFYANGSKKLECPLPFPSKMLHVSSVHGDK